MYNFFIKKKKKKYIYESKKKSLIDPSHIAIVKVELKWKSSNWGTNSCPSHCLKSKTSFVSVGKQSKFILYTIYTIYYLYIIYILLYFYSIPLSFLKLIRTFTYPVDAEYKTFLSWNLTSRTASFLMN